MTDQKALEATRYHVYFDAGRDELIAAPAPDGVWVRFSDLPKPEGEAVAVKPLEWDQVHSKVHREKAEALGFSYYLTLREPGYVLERRAGDYMSGLGSFDTIDLAKAAAQSDFDRCIRSALHPAPDAREAGLLRERQIAKISETIKHWLPDTPDWMMEPMATTLYNALHPAPVGEKPPEQTLAEVKDALGLPQETSTVDTFRASLEHARRAVGEKVETALNDIAVERERQKAAEGWTEEHDDNHVRGEMALAAACYAVTDFPGEAAQIAAREVWPWEGKWWTPKDFRRNLVRAGALIVAEIERHDRIAAKRTASRSPANE